MQITKCKTSIPAKRLVPRLHKALATIITDSISSTKFVKKLAFLRILFYYIKIRDNIVIAINQISFMKNIIISILFLSILISCSDDEQLMNESRLQAFIGIDQIEIIDLCAGKFNARFSGSSNKEITEYNWNIRGKTSNDQFFFVELDERETHMVSLGVTDINGETAGKNKLVNIELYIGNKTRSITGLDKYDFLIESPEIVNTPYTNELLTFKTDIESNDLIWEITYPNGQTEYLQGENDNGENLFKIQFTDEGQYRIQSYMCQDKFISTSKEMNLNVTEALGFSNARISNFRLSKVEGSDEVEAYFEIYVDGELKLKTTTKNYKNSNQNPQTWNTTNDIEQGEFNGVIDQLETHDTGIEIRLVVNDNPVVIDLKKADYLGHFSTITNSQKIDIGDSNSLYQFQVVIDNVF